MDDLDIFRAANLLVKQHGLDADFHAAQRADELLAVGDSKGFAVWQRITAAVKVLLAGPEDQLKH